MPIQGLLSSIPQLDPSLANRGAPIAGGLQAAQAMQLQQAQVQHDQLQNHIANLQTTQQLLASVRYNPTQQNYDNNKQLAINAGLGHLVQGLPADIRDAAPMIDSAYWSTGQGLARAKTTAQILSDQILMGSNAANANLKNFQQGQNPVFPGATGGNQFGNTGIPDLPALPTHGTPMNMGGGNQTSNPMQGAMMPSQSGMGGGSPIQTPQGNFGGMPLQPASTAPPYAGTGALGASSGLTPKAEMEKQNVQAKDWADFNQQVGATDAQYAQTNQNLDQVDSILNSGNVSNKLAGPGLPNIIANRIPSLAKLNSAATNLNIGFIQSFAKGMGRLDLPLVRALQFLTPGSDKITSQSQLESNTIRYRNEINHAMSQALPTFDQLQIRDPNKAGLMMSDAIMKTKAMDAKTGKLDMGKFQDWPNNLPQNVKDAYYTNNYVSQGVPVFKNSNGSYFTGTMIQHLAQLNKTDPQTVMQKYKLQPALNSQLTINPQQQQQLAQLQQQNPQMLG